MCNGAGFWQHHVLLDKWPSYCLAEKGKALPMKYSDGKMTPPVPTETEYAGNQYHVEWRWKAF